MRTLMNVLVLSLVVLPTVPAFPQATNSGNDKFSEIDREIKSLESKRQTGMIMVIGGGAVQVLSLALVPETKVDPYSGEVSDGSWAPFWLALGAGTVVGTIGVFKWYHASQELGPLKAKKYELGFTPTFDVSSKNVGIALALQF